MIGTREAVLMEEVRRACEYIGLGSAALAEIGSNIPESKKPNRIDLGILVSHEDGPCGDAPSRSLDLPELVAVWNRSQKARSEIIAEMEDWTLSGDW